MMDNLNNIYDWILAGIRDLSGSQNSEEALAEYLKSLQPYVKTLRKGYKQNCVNADYSDVATQMAYLITYYPHYAVMTRNILERIEPVNVQAIFSNQAYLSVCIFGSGPVPEAAGLISFIADKYPNIRFLVVRTFDIASETWRISQDIAKQYILPEIWTGKIALLTDKIDICQAGVFINFRDILKSSQVFIFQNCLNELQNIALLPSNLDILLEEIPANSLLIFADLIGYQQIYDIKDGIKSIVREKNALTKKKVNELMFEIQVPREPIVNIYSTLPIPIIITKNLLTGKPNDSESERELLIPRSIVKFNFISIYKRFSEQVPNIIETSQDIELMAASTEQKQLRRQMDELNRRLNYWTEVEREKRTRQFKLLSTFSIVALAVGFLAVLIAILAFLN
jgi:hypothetical protein